MIRLIGSLLSLIDKIIPMRKNKKDKKLLDENIQLKRAIERGDTEKIEQIRQRKRKYPNLILFLIIICFLFGCKSIRYKNIPIVGDNIPIELKVGSEYTNVTGEIGIVQPNKRYLVSDAYIFETVTRIDEKKN